MYRKIIFSISEVKRIKYLCVIKYYLWYFLFKFFADKNVMRKNDNLMEKNSSDEIF